MKYRYSPVSSKEVRPVKVGDLVTIKNSLGLRDPHLWKARDAGEIGLVVGMTTGNADVWFPTLADQGVDSLRCFKPHNLEVTIKGSDLQITQE